MPTYKVTDPNTGRTLRLTGDSPPTEGELEEIFASVGTESPKGTLQKIGEFAATSKALPIAGGIVGGIAGTLGGPAGSVGGAALGGAGGESYRQLLARGMGLPVPETSLEAAKDIGVEGGIQGVSEGVGRGVGQGLKLLAPPVGRGLSSFGELLTKVPRRQFPRLFKDPSALFKGTRKAGKALEETLQKEGIDLTPTVKEVIDPQLGQARKIAREVASKFKQGGQLTAEEAIRAKRALDRIIAGTSPKDKETIRNLVSLKSEINDALMAVSGPAGEASRQYARASLGGSFRNLLPQNVSARAQLARLGGFLLPATVGFGSGSIGAAAGMAGIQSPILAGGLTAGAGAASKFATSPLGRRSIVNPLVNALIQRKLNRESKTKNTNPGQ